MRRPFGSETRTVLGALPVVPQAGGNPGAVLPAGNRNASRPDGDMPPFPNSTCNGPEGTA